MVGKFLVVVCRLETLVCGLQVVMRVISLVSSPDIHLIGNNGVGVITHMSHRFRHECRIDGIPTTINLLR